MIFVEKTFVDAQLCCQKRPWQKCLGVTTKPQKFFSLERFLLYVVACFSVAQFLCYLCYSEPPGTVT